MNTKDTITDFDFIELDWLDLFCIWYSFRELRKFNYFRYEYKRLR